jgi:hypothetical protein
MVAHLCCLPGGRLPRCVDDRSIELGKPQRQRRGRRRQPGERLLVILMGGATQGLGFRLRVEGLRLRRSWRK